MILSTALDLLYIFIGILTLNLLGDLLLIMGESCSLVNSVFIKR